MAKDIKKQTKEITEELIKLLGIEATASVTESKGEGEEEKTLEVNIESDQETGLLIGAHGMTLNAIQIFLRMALRQATGDWVRIVVNIGDWKEKQEDHLTELAQTTAARALSTGQAQRLYNLTPSQRRIIHVKLSENEDVKTESEGEGAERYLVITPKSGKSA